MYKIFTCNYPSIQSFDLVDQTKWGANNSLLQRVTTNLRAWHGFVYFNGILRPFSLQKCH